MESINWVIWATIVPISLVALAYQRRSLIYWTATVAVALLTMTFMFHLPSRHFVYLWILFGLFTILFQINPIRRNILSRPLKKLLGKIIPRISVTEEEALLAGTVWWDGELFSGMPEWEKIIGLPAPGLSEKEQAFLDGPVEQLCAMLDEWEIIRDRNDLSPEAWDFMKKEGFFGMIIPDRYGGLEFSAVAHSAVILKLASRSVTAAVTAMVPNSLGPGQLILRYGTEMQKEYYLPRLADGTEIPCFALTSSVAGSDAASMLDHGVVCRGEYGGEKNVMGIRLNWDKRYITLAPVSTIMGLAFKLYDPEHLLGKEKEIGITLALVPTNLPGVEVGRRHLPLDQAFQNGPTKGHDVFIPMDNVVGGGDHVGQGWRMLMECLADGRSISLPALSAGLGKLATRSSGAYARIRKQFKTPIGFFEGVEEALTRIIGNTYAIEAVRLMTALAVDQREKPSVVSAIAKYHCTEKMRKIVNDAMDVFGGTAICLGPRNLLGRYYESIPISITVEGANILTRSLIIFGQGLIRCHPFLLSEMKALQDDDPKRALRKFDKAFWGHFGFTVSNVFRSFLLAGGSGILTPIPFEGRAVKYARQIVRLSTALALVSDGALVFMGGKLKRQEKLSARLGDILAQLYIASAAIKRFHDQGQPEEDEVLLDWVCQEALFTAQEQLVGFLSNFPAPFFARVLGFLIFPFGRRYRPPNDRLGARLVKGFLEPTASRDRLTGGIYISTNDQDGLGRIEKAFQLQTNVAAVEKKVREVLKERGIRPENEMESIDLAMKEKIINREEGQQLKTAYEAMLKAIAVDDF